MLAGVVSPRDLIEASHAFTREAELCSSVVSILPSNLLKARSHPCSSCVDLVPRHDARRSGSSGLAPEVSPAVVGCAAGSQSRSSQAQSPSAQEQALHRAEEVAEVGGNQDRKQKNLRSLCWNIEGQRRLEDVPLPPDWDILLFQECSLRFDDAPHTWKACLSHNQRTHAVVVVHSRLAAEITAWGGDAFPWIFLSRWDLATTSLYLPSIGRPDAEWDDGMLHLHHVIWQMRAFTDRVCIGGDLNSTLR